LTEDIIIVAALVITLVLVFSKKISDSKTWHATVTPLASIIGSGFLVIAPLLVSIAGMKALAAIFVIVALGYACGEVMRFNIQNIEEKKEHTSASSLIEVGEKISKLSLGIAYIISVTFYLQLLSAFLLKGFHLENPTYANILTTVCILAIALIGKFRGLKKLESLEQFSVNIKLSIIAGLICGLLVYNIDLFIGGHWRLQISPHEMDFESFRKLFGSLIVIQGFETSRFIGSQYSANLRVTTMRYAQSISGIIYILFVGLILVVFTKNIHVSDTEIIDLSGRVSSILPHLLIFAAVLSQLSAAVADTIGSGGLIFETSKKKISMPNSYLVIGSFAIALTWLADVFQIITFASQAFSFFYCLQSLEAAIFSFKDQKWIRGFLFTCLSLFLSAIVILGLPANV
jgi:hypothetical protein